LLALLLVGAAQADNGAQLAAGNGVWIRPSSTTQVTSNPTLVVSNLQARSIKHIFLFAVGYTSSQYAQFVPFIQAAHNSGLTVHPVCATKTTVLDAGSLSPTLLSNIISQVLIFNTNNPTAQFDGLQLDIEGTNGPALSNLVSNVHVPFPLVFSAAVQPEEFYSNVEPYYYRLIQNTDLSVLIPMIYIMDDLGYSKGNLTYGFSITGSDSISYKTTEILARLPSHGQMMTGLSAYDYEAAVTKGGGPNWTPTGGWWGSQMAFSGGSYAVPNLAAHYPLVSVAYQPITGLSSYRFDYSSTNWFDVNEMTPIGLGRSIAAANQAGTNDARYLGTCTFVYHTVFDSTSERQAGLTMNNTNYPGPQVSLQVLSIQGNLAHLLVTLTNANPSEQILGDSASAGVHLQLPPGASFVSADAGAFHAALAFDTLGNQLGSISGARVLELRRYFFENLATQQAQSGEIVVTAMSPFALQYRAWMTAKDSLCSDSGTAVPYLARSPDDVHYSAPSGFMTYATFGTNVAVGPCAGSGQPLFTQLPASQTVYAGNTACFTPQMVGEPTVAYQWKFNNTDLAGATSLGLCLTNVDYTNAGPYTLAATNACGGVLSPTVTLAVMAPAWVTNLTYRVSAAGPGSGQTLELIWPAGALYSATNVMGPWTAVTGALLPYYAAPINPTATSLFFKAE
jgi:hypothetical protein